MKYHRYCVRLACIVLLLLMAGPVFPAAAQAGPFREAPSSLGAEPARLVDILWRWIADHLIPESPTPGDQPVHLSGDEGWGMDPNGGR